MENDWNIMGGKKELSGFFMGKYCMMKETLRIE
jgi:hypothetical protein